MKKIIMLAAIPAFLLAGCIGSVGTGETPTRGNIKISVDESFKLVMESEVSTFESIYTYAIINAAYKPEVDCITDLMNDSVRLVVVGRTLTTDEETFLKNQKLVPRTTKIAYDGLAFIVNRNNPDSLITFEKLRDIFAGKIADWKDVNPKSELGGLKVVFDNNKSANPRYVREKFRVSKFPEYCYAVNSNDEVISFVETNPNAMGIISVNWISDKNDTVSNRFLQKIKVMAISDEGNTDGPFHKPYQAYIADGSYPLVREVYVISREYFSGLGTGFASFVAGDQGQRIILKSGLVPATMPVRIVDVKH